MRPIEPARDPWTAAGAAAGAVGVAAFAAASLVLPERPPFDAAGGELAAWFGDDRTRIQLACAVYAFAAPLLVWFLTTVASLARAVGGGARRAGSLAFGCGIAFVALLMADIATIAVGALRPGNMAAEPELADALRDFEFMLMAMATPLVAAMLSAFAVLGLRDGLWPRWVGLLAGVAAALYLLRIGTLFTTDGPFAADGTLGLWLPVLALTSWLAVGSVALSIRLAAPRTTGSSSDRGDVHAG